MRTLRTLVMISVVAVLPGAIIAKTPAHSGVDPANPVVPSVRFNVGAKTNVPGKALKPGAYDIAIVDQISDRVIVRVTTLNGQVETTFLGVYNPRLTASKGTGPISWTQSHKDNNALRGFAFPSSKVVEFVYSKAEAVTIAKANSAKVLAIDPASDNLHLKHNKLTQDEMLVVTLWSLNSTRVGPNDQPAIEATRYQNQQRDDAVRLAAVAPGPDARARKPSSTNALLASNAHRPIIGSLPHTANDIVAPLLASLMAFAAAGFLYLRRLSARAD